MSELELVTELRRAWLRSGLTQTEIGRQVGIEPGSVSNIFSARYGARVDTLIRLADALGYDLALVPKEDA